MAWFIFVAVLLGFALFGFISWAVDRAAKSAKVIGAPTPEDARIKKEADDIAARVKAQADKDKLEVQNASGAQLYDLARKRLRDGK